MAMLPFYGTSPDDENLDEAYKYARLTPPQQLALERRLFQRGGERAAEGLIRTGLGLPESAGNKRQAAAEELRVLSRTARPGTAEFYDKALPILQKYDLVAEAEQMEGARMKLEAGKGELDPVLKMQRAYDLLKKRFDAGDTSVEPAMKTLLQNIKDARPAKQTAGGADPEFIKLLNAYEAAVAAGQGDRAEMIKKALDAWLKAKESSGQDVAWARLALAQMIEGRQVKKEERRVTLEDEAVVSAVQGAVKQLDVEIQAGERLATHPGVSAITGDVFGALPLAAVAVRSKGAGALYAPIEGQLFIRALQDLKATSKTGASGLGQLTEIEGGKIQAARAALQRQQPTAQFLRSLAAYVLTLKDARKEAENILTKRGGTIPVAPPIVADVPVKVAPRTVVPAPAAAPAKRTFKFTPVK